MISSQQHAKCDQIFVQIIIDIDIMYLTQSEANHPHDYHEQFPNTSVLYGWKH